MALSGTASSRRQQRIQSLLIDRVAKGLSVVMWGVSAARFLAHGAGLEACVALACCLTAAILLAASLYRRCCYARFMPHTTAAALLQAHGAAAFVCVTGVHMLAGRCGCCLAWSLLLFGRCWGWLLWRSGAGTAAAHDLLLLPWVCNLATLPLHALPCLLAHLINPPSLLLCSHSSNVFRFCFISLVHNTSFFQARSSVWGISMAACQQRLLCVRAGVYGCVPRLRACLRCVLRCLSPNTEQIQVLAVLNSRPTTGMPMRALI